MTLISQTWTLKETMFQGCSASDAEGLAGIKSDVRRAFEQSRASGDGGSNWQGLVDMIVTRYPDLLQLMAAERSSKGAMLTEIGVLLNMFVDYENLEDPKVIERRSTYYLGAVVPQTASDHLIQEAILDVTDKICTVLLLFEIEGLLLKSDNKEKKRKEKAQDSALKESKYALRMLVEYLIWSTWSER